MHCCCLLLGHAQDVQFHFTSCVTVVVITHLSSLSLMFLLVTNLPSLPAKGLVFTCSSRKSKQVLRFKHH
jgi:hypothetical protein